MHTEVSFLQGAKQLKQQSGQSLIEVLIAIGLGVIMIVGAITVIVPALNIDKNAQNIQVAASLGRELLEQTRTLAEGSWDDINNIATTSINKFHVDATSSPFSIATGEEEITVSTSTYTRYFYIDDVYRNVSDNIEVGGSIFDPSTKKITVIYSWPPRNTTSSFVSYITRNGNNVFWQTDWSGGGGQEGPITSTTTNSSFATSTSIDISTSTGSIVIEGF